MTAQQPLNNIIRVALEAAASVLGGVQILATSSYDEAFATPSKLAATVALRTQQIIAYETGIINTADPLGGSYYLERLTHEIEEKVWSYLIRIDEMGGAIPAIEKSFFQKEIEEAAYQYQKEIETQEKIIVGRNEFKSEEKVKIETVKVNPEEEERQVQKLIETKKSREGSKVEECLGLLKKDALEGKNVIPATLGAVKAYATIGEICSVWKEVFGESKEVYLQ